MKKALFLQSLICLFAVSCTVQEFDSLTPPQPEDVVFYASLESSQPDTKVVLDENIKILWDVDDRITIFNESTLNQQFMFDGEEQANSGTFSWVQDEYFGAGNDLDYICAVYPYRESTTINNSDVLTLTLPAVQDYREKSFGRGANTMVSVTNDHLLRFKNVGGYLALKFYGEDVTVKTITLAGNSGELLAGDATLTLPFGEEPNIEMAQNAKKSVFLDCGENGVELGESADDATIFWLVVPPTHFEHGFTLTVTDMNGDIFVKETDKNLTIARNGVLRIKAIEVDMGGDDLFLRGIAPVDVSPHKTELVEADRTVTVTMPTVTDFSDLLFHYTLASDDDEKVLKVLVNGIPVVNGETRVDASGEETSIIVHDGLHGKRYQLFTKNTGLPVVRINTEDFFALSVLESYQNSLQSSDEADHRVWLPEGKNDFISIRIENPDGSPGMATKDGVSTYKTDTKIKGRGNYTWTWEKKPYALKFDQKTEVLGMPAHKRWILLANWRDHTLLRNDVTFELSRRAGLPYTVSGQFVELEFNGEYRGNYYLCEQIKIDENRVNITPFDENFDDLTGGYLMEIDSYWDEVNKFHSQYFNLNYMFKEPDEDPADAATDSHFALGYAWMENYINEFERVLKTKECVENGEYEDYLNVDSAILFMLLNEVSGNRDFFQGYPHNGPHSTYLYKGKIQDKDLNGDRSKLFMGPGWDFDYETFIPAKWYSNKTYQWRGFKQTGYYYHYLCHNQSFVNQVKSLWNSKMSLFQDVATDNTGYIDKMVEKILLSEEFDAERWPFNRNQENRNDNHDFYDDGTYYSYQEAIDLMKSSLLSRITWMNNQINSSSFTTTSPSWKYTYKRQWPTN